MIRARIGRVPLPRVRAIGSSVRASGLLATVASKATTDGRIRRTRCAEPPAPPCHGSGLRGDWWHERDRIRLVGIAIDCPDAEPVARFYQRASGLGYATLNRPTGRD
jgi:hypothetical protein